eukprot:CAMPEP_0204208700 /NCGR_PEP_ID=MMETSP0361-20130328/72672_1 /ASSEMBLY_ACC=CAM_ASM_000343 /TAXON_ID=268821 /ORGANISM="Scrippsiella Hangoei, Strain SHTV-5" /LENGTH=365 /DNA_ID=CAMNT_0051172529 /DNA_START=21 /DNA_END=1118 /DNA_ORIENTATION=-
MAATAPTTRRRRRCGVAAGRLTAGLLLVALARHADAGAAGAGGGGGAVGVDGSRRVLSPEAAEDYRRRGHLLTRGVLNRSEVEGVASTLSELLLEHGRRAFAGDGGKKEVRFTFAVHELSPSVAAFVADVRGDLWRAAAKLAGTEDLCLLMDRGFSKDPGDLETHWHRDDEAIGLPAQHPEVRTVHAWIPLSAMGRDMGTLQYLLGTHLRTHGALDSLLASLWGWEFAWFMTAPRAQDDELELGDIAWHDGWVLHSAGANAGDGVRNGMAASFAFCAGPSNCDGLAAQASATDVTCKAASLLFDAGWLARHRNGEEDYAKILLQEPFLYRSGRFLWRSMVGALGGLALHSFCVWVGKPRSKDKAT